MGGALNWHPAPYCCVNGVTVTAEGTFKYEGKFFKSLSAVARHISGTPWSGPLFFGLKTNRKEAA